MAPVVPANSLASLVSLAGTTGYSDDTLRVFRPLSDGITCGTVSGSRIRGLRRERRLRRGRGRTGVELSWVDGR